MNNDDNLDLLDLDDGTSDVLPPAAPFAAPRPKKPWLLLGVGVLIIILATYIIVSTVGGDSSSSMDVDLDAPEIVVDGGDAPLVVGDVTTDAAVVNVEPVVVPVAPQPVAQAKPAPAVAKPAPQAQNVGAPVRVIEERPTVTFNPDKPAVAKPAPKKVVKQAAPAKKSAPKAAATTPKRANYYVQIGSYSTRALAQAGQRQLQNKHRSLLSGHEFVILAAQVKDGSTLYRLRVPFANAKDANGFCRNAKSDGLDCYVTK